METKVPWSTYPITKALQPWLQSIRIHRKQRRKIPSNPPWAPGVIVPDWPHESHHYVSKYSALIVRSSRCCSRSIKFSRAPELKTVQNFDNAGTVGLLDGRLRRRTARHERLERGKVHDEPDINSSPLFILQNTNPSFAEIEF